MADGNPQTDGSTAQAAAPAAQESKPEPAQFKSETSRFISAWEHPDGEASARTQSSIRPHWPKGASGLTIGMGYDLKYHTADELRKDWGGVLSPEQIQRLEAYTATINTKGKRVPPKKKPNKAALIATRDIEVRYKDAVKVFEDNIQPKWEETAYKVFPGLEHMDPYTKAAVVSMVYNRGGGLGKKKSLRRKHFMDIKEAVIRRDTRGIAATLRAMKAEHTNPANKKGLHRRREAEAQLIESNQRAVDLWYGVEPAVP